MLNVSINMKANKCPNCAASLGPATSSFIKCAYCESEFYLPPLAGFQIPEPRDYPRPPALGRVEVGEHAYLVHGRVAQGQHSQVFLARRDRALTELVLLKVARDGEEEGVRREWAALEKVREQHAYLRYLTNAPVKLAQGRCPGHQPRLTAVYRWRCGFSFTFDDARRQYPDGVKAHAVVWMWNRILDQLACLHDAGYAHNAIAPEHLLLNPQDHGVAFCGWSEAARGPGREDLRRSGQCIARLLDPRAPRPLRRLADDAGGYRCAAALKQELRVVSEAVFGPPKFHHFTLA